MYSAKHHSMLQKSSKYNQNLTEFQKFSPFDFLKPTVKGISLIIKSLSLRKAADPDCISLKLIKFTSNIIDSHICNTIIKDLEEKQVLRRAKNSFSKTHFQEK